MSLKMVGNINAEHVPLYPHYVSICWLYHIYTINHIPYMMIILLTNDLVTVGHTLKTPSPMS